MTTSSRITRRRALATLAAGFAAPFVFRAHAHAAPSGTLYHASFGAAGQAIGDIRALARSPHFRLVAVADVDLRRTAEVRQLFPNVRVYQDWRQLLDRERNLNSVNVSTPDHMHGSITMRAMQQGLHVYTQKPLTQTIHEARQLTRVARERRLVSQMGIQIHSHEVHRTVVATIHAGAIGRVREVHSWSGKHWGDLNPRPSRRDAVPSELSWDGWLGVAAERPYLANYYHPFVWRARLDFGTGTFGDMGCHLLDPVFTSLALTAPRSVRSEGNAPGPDSWSPNAQVQYVFPGTRYTTDTLTLHWYDGDRRPPGSVQALIGNRPYNDQGSIYLGSEGVLYSPYIAAPMLFAEGRRRDYRFPTPGPEDHYLQFVEACRGNGRTSAPFDYSGPLTEGVLLGCLSTRFPRTTLEWDAAQLHVSNHPEANTYVRRRVRQGWEVQGL
jgi:predicted dehydrogenase